MKLWELPTMSPLRVYLQDGTEVEATFHHIDGMYSFCTTDGVERQVFHLHFATPMVEVNGRWEVAND